MNELLAAALAALEDEDGRIVTGCNIENATYGLTSYKTPAGISPQKINHEEVLEIGARVRGTFVRLLKALLPRL